MDGNVWELIGLENGLTVWAKCGDRSLYASSVILPVSLKVWCSFQSHPKVWVFCERCGCFVKGVGFLWVDLYVVEHPLNPDDLAASTVTMIYL